MSECPGHPADEFSPMGETTYCDGSCNKASAAIPYRPHPENPHGILVPCASCGEEIHMPKTDLERVSGPVTCSHDCMVAAQKKSSAVLDYTVGRATNDVLEQAVAVWFKHEWEDDDGNEAGPIYVQVGGSTPDNDANPMPYDGDLVPFNKGESEWHSADYAEALARELGVPVVWS